LEKFKSKKEELIQKSEVKLKQTEFQLIPIENREGGWLTERGSTAKIDQNGIINIPTTKTR
jgi:hypothetical protein